MKRCFDRTDSRRSSFAPWRVLVPIVTAGLLGACGAQPESESRGLSFEEDYEQVVSVFEAAEDEASTYHLWEGLIRRHPNEPHSMTVLNWLVNEKYLGDEPDYKGAIALVSQQLAAITDPRNAIRGEMTLLRIYAKSGSVSEFEQLMTRFIDEGKVRVGTYDALIEACETLPSWNMSMAVSRHLLEAVSVASLRDEWGGSDLPDEEIEISVRRTKGLCQTNIGRARLEQGNLEDALRSFEAAAEIAPMAFHKSFYDLNLHWARALLEAGQAGRAAEVVAADALILDRPEAREVFDRAFVEQGGDMAAIEAHALDLEHRIAPTIPDFVAHAYDGQNVSWDTAKGRVTLLSFWFPGCPPCREELPALQKLYKKYGDQGLAVIALDTQRQTEQAQAFIKKHGLTYQMLENPSGEDEVAKNVFGVVRHPTLYVVAEDGKLVSVHHAFNGDTEELLEAEVRKLLGV